MKILPSLLFFLTLLTSQSTISAMGHREPPPPYNFFNDPYTSHALEGILWGGTGGIARHLCSKNSEYKEFWTLVWFTMPGLLFAITTADNNQVSREKRIPTSESPYYGGLAAISYSATYLLVIRLLEKMNL